jgi:protein SCO1/2
MLSINKTSSIAIFFVCTLLFFSNCGGTNHSHSTRQFQLTGKVVAVDLDRDELTISHQAIPGYMSAMTMPFKLKERGMVRMIQPGDEITADLFVDGSASWLEHPVTTRVTEDSTTNPAGSAPVEPAVGATVPNFQLLNQDGHKIDIGHYRGKALALTFIYTRCPLPDYCIRMNDNFSEVERKAASDPAIYERTHLLTISFDPEHDTPAVLRTFGSARTGTRGEKAFEHWEFATGSGEQIKAIAEYFGLTYMEQTGQIVHSLRTAVIDPSGKLVMLYRGNEWTPDELLANLKQASQLEK